MGLKDGGVFIINNVLLYILDLMYGQLILFIMIVFNFGMGKGDSGVIFGNF